MEPLMENGVVPTLDAAKDQARDLYKLARDCGLSVNLSWIYEQMSRAAGYPNWSHFCEAIQAAKLNGDGEMK
jgi:hypothetical protein